jgi:hypothetical protein
MLVVGALLAIPADMAVAVIPNSDRIANTVALTNRASGRAVPVLVDVTLTIGGNEPLASGVLASHPTGLARLELRSAKGFVERHLLQGNAHTASRDGEMLTNPRPFLPPLFLLQATSGAALRAALTSFGVASVQSTLGKVGERDCYVLGGRLKYGERFAPGVGEILLPSFWVDIENYEVVQIDRPDGVRYRFGPSADFGGIRLPRWIEVESRSEPTARLEVDRVAPANAPAAAFGTHWLSAPANP